VDGGGRQRGQGGVEPPPGVEVVDTGGAWWWVEPDGLAGHRNHADLVTEQHVRDGLRALRALSGGRRVPLVAETGPLGGSERGARDALAGPEAVATIAAMGVVVRTPVARALMNLFVRLSRPPYPIRVFATAAEARAWLLREHPPS
jgi:hypothetical protein